MHARVTDSRPADLQIIQAPPAEIQCAVLRGPLLLLIPGTLMVSESQVLFRSRVSNGNGIVLELPLRHITSVESTRVHLGIPAIRIRRGRESNVFANFGPLGGIGPRVLDQLSAPLRGWEGSCRDAVLEKISRLWSVERSPGGSGEPVKGLAARICRCCVPVNAAGEGVNHALVNHADLTHSSPLAHMMISIELPCSTKRAQHLLFADESAFEARGKELVGGADVRVTPWRREGVDGAIYSAREVRWQQSLRALPGPLIDQLGLQSAVSAVMQTRCCEPRPGTFISVGVVRVDVPFGETFVMRSKWVLLAAPPAPGEDRSPGRDATCALEVSYEVVFTKHVMLAPVIESANLREARRSFTALIPLIKETVSPTC